MKRYEFQVTERKKHTSLYYIDVPDDHTEKDVLRVIEDVVKNSSMNEEDFRDEHDGTWNKDLSPMNNLDYFLEDNYDHDVDSSSFETMLKLDEFENGKKIRETEWLPD